MPKLNDVCHLIRSVGDRDFTRARSQVVAMIANERSNNREGAAASLEQVLKSWGDKNSKLVELPHDLRQTLYTPPKLKCLSELFLSDDIRNAIVDFIAEREKAGVLKDHGLPLRNRILLAGPPGNGKTSLAGAVANELNLPFYMLNIAEVVSSYMGSTSKNISKVFEYAYINRCVILLDEIDAIAGARKGAIETASREYNLITNTLLMALDRLPDTAVIVGASNMPDLLDEAIVRRFNLKCWLDTPLHADLVDYIEKYMDKTTVCFDADVSSLEGQPWSKVEEYCIEQHRRLLIGGETLGMGWIGKGA